MIQTETHGSVTLLRFAHGKASALDLEFLQAITDAFARERGSNSRALVLTGTGSIFSAGVDLHRLVEGGKDYVARFLPALDECFLSLFTFEKPVVAAINGHAIAGGMMIAAASDHRILAAGRATVGIPELKVGVPFPLAALEVVRHALAPHVLQEAVFTGRMYRVEECLARGIVDEVVEPANLIERALERASELAAFPTASYALTKRQMRLPALDTIERHGARARAEALAVWSDPTTLAAVRSYVERTIKK